MHNNVIINNKDELVGYFADILEHLKEEFITEIKNNNFSVISPEWLELLEDVKKYEECEGLLVVSEHNGMGWTVSPYKGEA